MGLLGAVIEKAWQGDPDCRSDLCLFLAEALMNVRHSTGMTIVSVVDPKEQQKHIDAMPIHRFLRPSARVIEAPSVPGGHRE